jgi:hypothetical protein
MAPFSDDPSDPSTVVELDGISDAHKTPGPHLVFPDDISMKVQLSAGRSSARRNTLPVMTTAFALEASRHGQSPSKK